MVKSKLERAWERFVAVVWTTAVLGAAFAASGVLISVLLQGHHKPTLVLLGKRPSRGLHITCSQLPSPPPTIPKVHKYFLHRPARITLNVCSSSLTRLTHGAPLVFLLGDLFASTAVGAVFVLISLPVSLGCIWAHLDNYVCPELQVHVLRILWMTPIYSVNALVSLILVYCCQAHLTVYPDTLREGYEAYCILSFFSLLVTWGRLFHGRDISHLLQERYGEVPIDHLPPCRIQFGQRVWTPIQPWPSEVFVERCKYGVMTYVVATPICTTLTFILSITGSIEGDALTLGNPYTYISLVRNPSPSLALSCPNKMFGVCVYL